MPKLSKNEWYTRRASREIAHVLDLPEEVVRAVIDALALHILEDIRKQGIKDKNNPSKINIELPNIGTFELFPAKYPDNEYAILQGRAFKPKFSIRENFLLKCRYAYYDNHNYLLEEITKQFSGMITDHYHSIVKIDNEEEGN